MPADREASISLAPSYPIGSSHLVATLYYNSEKWNALLREAIDSLLAAFHSAYSEPRCSTSETVELSPFQLFKRIWFSEGWGKLHALGAGDLRGRPVWADSIYSGFLQHLHEGEQPVYQLAALFGIYAFYSTQDKTLNRVRISIDPPTLDHLISLPESLAEFVDFRPTILPPSNPTPSVVRLITSESSTLQVVPSLDITYVVHTLLANEVFYIIPSETFLFPPSPQVTIEDPKLPARAEARRKLGVLVEEMERLKKAEIRPDTNYKGMTTVSYKTDPAVDWTTHLIDLEKKYAEHKATSVESLISNPLGNFQHSYAKGLVEGAKKKTLGHMRNLQADSGGEGGGRVDLANSLMGGGTDFLGLIGSGMKEYEEIMGELNRDLVAAGGPAIDLGGDEMELDIVETE